MSDWYTDLDDSAVKQFDCTNIADIDKHTTAYTTKHTRITTTPHTSSARYLLPTRPFLNQFSHLYYCRLNKLRDRALDTAQKYFEQRNESGVSVCHKILDLKAGQRCIVAGTLYKDMKLKPSILDELAHTNKKMELDKLTNMTQVQNVYSYITQDDSVILEDEFGRVQLGCTDSTVFNINHYVSGIVMALCGEVNDENDKFMITNVFYPSLPSTTVPRAISRPTTPDYILLVSGLSIGRPNGNHSSIEALIDYISGVNGNTNEQSHAAQISRVIIAGNSLHRFDKKATKDFMKQELDVQELAYPLKQMDAILTQLCSAVDVHLMPGVLDPANYTVPQQPLHAALLPSASTYNTLHSETNPAELIVNGDVRILGTSGQTVADMRKYTHYTEPIELLEHTLQWCHVAPTAPDTLACYPYEDTDPFTIDTAPCIYFSGNSEKFETKLYVNENKQQTRLIMIPTFSSTQTAVLVNLNSPELDCIPVHFPAY